MGADPVPVIDPALLPTLVTQEDAAAEGASLSFRSGNTYTGDLLGATTMEGSGTYRWSSSGVTYEGDFDANTMTGNGTYSWPDGSQYVGAVRAGIRHGVGTFSGPGGYPKYEGEWHEGRRHGKGKLTYAAGGDVYDGAWADDVRHGEGTLTHASGNTYSGQWKDDRKDGRGTFEWHDRRERYTGQWRLGLPHGQGEHIWLRVQVDASPFQLRERYTGEWVEGRREGRGTFFFANGARYVGEWVGNQKHGEGLLSFEDGSVYQGPFVKDRMAEGKLRAHSELYSYIDITHLVPPAQLDTMGSAVRAALIRHNTDLKQVYRYYAALRCAAEDAFELSLEQFWAFVVDAQLVSPALSLADIDQVVMKGAAPPLPPLPAPLALATQVRDGGATYTHTGMHDGKRTLLLRDFIQGLVEIAAVRLSLVPPTITPPVQPLVQSLLDLVRISILEMKPSAESTRAMGLGVSRSSDATGEGEAPLDKATASRVALVYAHCARTERMPRFRKAPKEPTMTVSGYVRLLSEASLLPAHSNVPLLLSSTLPSYLMPPPEPEPAPAPAPAPAEVEGEEGAVGDEEGGEPESKDGPVEVIETEEERKARRKAEAEAEAAMIERLEEKLTMELTYIEFQATLLSFAAHFPTADTLPPWAPPPPAEAEGEEGAEAEAAAAAAADVEAGGEEDEEPPPPPPPPPPRSAAEVLREMVLPAVGKSLFARLETQASSAA